MKRATPQKRIIAMGQTVSIAGAGLKARGGVVARQLKTSFEQHAMKKAGIGPAKNIFSRHSSRRARRNVAEARQFAEQNLTSKKFLHNMRGIDGLNT
jgi:hypothetical protein